MNSTDVVVVGAGVIGLACAHRLAETGRSVVVIDASGSTGASWAAAGMLAPVSEAGFDEDELIALNVAAVSQFRAMAAELDTPTGPGVGLRCEGTLNVAFNADDRAALDRLTAFRLDLGLDTQPLVGSAVRRLEPYLASEVRSGVLALGDLSVDNRRFVRALQDAVAALGVRVVSDTVSALTGPDGSAVDLCGAPRPARVTGVRTSRGDQWATDAVVLCTGASTGRLTGYPVHPVKGQILRLSIPPRLSTRRAVLRHTVRGLVRGSEVYLVPRADGEVVVGATQEQQGFDTTVTAGGVFELLRNAYELFPISSEFELVEARAGLRPGTPDNGPLLGLVHPGLVVATGHHRNGILLSASTAAAVTRLVAGQPVAPQWAPFHPDRFSQARPGFAGPTQAAAMTGSGPSCNSS